MHPREIKIKDFTYDLPEDRIAKYPLDERVLSKLLIYRDGEISEDTYSNISEHIPSNALLIFNNTKVIQARLFFQNSTGAKIEIFCLEPAEENSEMSSVMSRKKSVRWACLVGGAKKWKEKILEHRADVFVLTAQIIQRTNDAFIIEFAWRPEDLSFSQILEQVGMIPIPPYLKRESEDLDSARYQTVYAKHKGSVAAPTAGLHFTDNIFAKLKAKNISIDEVTLHVGAGTFKPVKSKTMQDHEMHEELIDVRMETIERLVKMISEKVHTIIAVGTTSLRTVETLYWMGVKSKLAPESLLHELEIKQWDVYESTLQGFSTEMALAGLVSWMKNNETERLICKTQIMIAPAYQLKIVNALVTNFHQPNSTLLLLVAAIVGEAWKKIYQHALGNDFRFLSYGDGSLLFAKR